MSKFKKEEDFVKEQPLDKVDKNLRHIFGLLIEKDWKTAKSLVKLMGEGSEEAKELSNGFDQLIDFLKGFASGKELKAAVKYRDSIILNDELDKLLPKMDEAEFEELKTDISNHGILIPLVVQNTADGLLLIDGYTRYRAAEELGLQRVPVVEVPSTLDPKNLAIIVNCQRRNLTKSQRDACINSIPVPKVGRPVKGEKVISKKDLAKELGISESTVARARSKTTGDKSGKKKTKPKQICTPPDKAGEEAVSPLYTDKELVENTTGIDWFPDKRRDVFDKFGFIKGIGYSMEFTKDKVNYDYLAKNTETCMKELVLAIEKAGLLEQVDKFRMTVSFEARKKEVK